MTFFMFSADATNRFCQRLMALPLLPHENITAMFNILSTEANTEKLVDLCSYIENTWIKGQLWNLKRWECIYATIEYKKRL